MKLLLTGATGFVGLNLVQYLLDHDFINVTVLVRDKSKLPENLLTSV